MAVGLSAVFGHPKGHIMDSSLVSIISRNPRALSITFYPYPSWVLLHYNWTQEVQSMEGRDFFLTFGPVNSIFVQWAGAAIAGVIQTAPLPKRQPVSSLKKLGVQVPGVRCQGSSLTPEP
jgi:hypothetical protein